MKRIYFSTLLAICVIGMASCSGNKSNKEKNGLDSAAIAQAKADSIAMADSIARADSIEKANTLHVGMKVSEALQKPGVKKVIDEDMTDINGMGAFREYDTLILKQKGKKFLTNVTFIWSGTDYVCQNLKFDILPKKYITNMAGIKAKDCAASAKIVKEIK